MKGKITQGHFYPFDKEGMEKKMQSLEGQVVEVSVKKYKKDRSLEQHQYYRVLVRILSNDLGYEEDEMHEVLKSLFLKKTVDFKGESYIIIKSTRSLKTDEFMEYIEKIKRWASITHGIVLPEAKK